MEYTISDFNDIENNYNIEELNNITIKVINNIAKKVGSSTYKKTPIFRKKRFENKNNNFKKTNFEAKIDEQEIIIDKIRNLLNKLTKNNYDEIKDEIIISIKHFSYSRNNIVLINICKEIFNISSINKFWSSIYADLTYDLITAFPIMKEICENNYNSFLTIFEKIEIGKEEDYDNFCKINNINEKRRSLSKFYTCLNKKTVLSNNHIQQILNKLFTYVRENYELKECKGVIEEVFENVLIILDNLNEDLIENEKIIDELKEIFCLINENNVSKKISFKLLDFFENNDIDVDE